MEIVRSNLGMFKIKTNTGPLPDKLKGDFTSEKKAIDALTEFQAMVRAKVKMTPAQVRRNKSRKEYIARQRLALKNQSKAEHHAPDHHSSAA